MALGAAGHINHISNGACSGCCLLLICMKWISASRDFKPKANRDMYRKENNIIVENQQIEDAYIAILERVIYAKEAERNV